MTPCRRSVNDLRCVWCRPKALIARASSILRPMQIFRINLSGICPFQGKPSRQSPVETLFSAHLCNDTSMCQKGLHSAPCRHRCVRRPSGYGALGAVNEVFSAST